MAAAAALSACGPGPQQTPLWMACKMDTSNTDASKSKATSCAQIISQGAIGDDLETAYRMHGDAEQALGDDNAAVADYSQALKLRPLDGDALDGRAYAYLDQSKYDPAIADLTAAIRINPSDGTAFDYRGAASRDKGDLAAAFQDEDRAIELKPAWAGPWAERGYAYLDEHRYDMALADFGQAEQLDATLTFAFDGSAEANSDKGDVKDAVQAYEQAGNLYIGKKDYVSALADADKEVALEPADPEALNSRCWTMAIANQRLGEALTDCQKSLAIRPGAADVLDSLGFVQFRQGHFADAIQSYSAALAKAPKQASSLYMRGVAKLRAGDQDGGQSDIDAAKAADASVADQFTGYGVTP